MWKSIISIDFIKRIYRSTGYTRSCKNSFSPILIPKTISFYGIYSAFVIIFPFGSFAPCCFKPYLIIDSLFSIFVPCQVGSNLLVLKNIVSNIIYKQLFHFYV